MKPVFISVFVGLCVCLYFLRVAFPWSDRAKNCRVSHTLSYLANLFCFVISRKGGQYLNKTGYLGRLLWDSSKNQFFDHITVEMKET